MKSDVELPHAREIEQTLASSQNDQGSWRRSISIARSVWSNRNVTPMRSPS